MVKLFEVFAVKIKAVHHACLEIRHKELLMRFVIGYIAQSSTRIIPLVQADIGKQADLPRLAIKLVDRARTSAFNTAPLPVHPFGVSLAVA